MLFNVVEEMRIASGLPMPKVYVIPEASPNAFATGRDPEHASVAVTRGLLQRLDREELQGVVGHELAHVANYYIRFSLLVGVPGLGRRRSRRLAPRRRCEDWFGAGGADHRRRRRRR